MKRTFYNIIAFFTSVSILSSCSKTLEKNYTDPNKVNVGSIDRVFTSLLINRRIQPTYWDYRTFILPTTAAFAQLTATTTGPNMWFPSLDYGQDRWTDFYSASPGIANEYAEMTNLYSALSDANKATYLPYMEIGKVLLYDQASQMVDLWGDIPFSEANLLNTDRTSHNAKYDDASTLYHAFIDSLDAVNTYLKDNSPSSVTSSSMTKQDLIFKGDYTSWRRYANSLRLRLLMRISNVDESTSKTEVSKMLNDPATYPLIEQNSDNALLAMSPTNFNSDILSAFTDNSGQYSFAPQYLLDTVMLTNNDPRMAVMFNKTTDGKFKGMPNDAGSGTYSNGVGVYSTYDSATFMYNYNVPGVLFTAAETDLLKAEASLRWNLGDASTLYYAGIRSSIDFFYSIQQDAIWNEKTFTKDPLPTEAQIVTFLAQTAVAYSGSTDEKLAKICTQRWLNYSILQGGQAWADVRRTGYPKLHFFTASSAAYAQPPYRLLYPATETTYNTAYKDVESKDKRDTKIFWMQ